MFDSIGYISEQAIVLRLKESLHYELKGYKDTIKVSNDVMNDKERKKREKIRSYKLLQWGKGKNLIF